MAQFATCATGLALLLSPMFGHFDDTDAQLYQVVVRKLASRGRWWDPHYLTHFLPHFREHLPFGLLPFAGAVSLCGESAARLVAAAFSMATLVGSLVVGRKLLGFWPGLLATLTLATTETFFRYGAATRLDPLLILLANAAAAPILLGAKGLGGWSAAAAAASLATLVKGPFGLVPFAAAACARAWSDRAWQPLLLGAAGTILACAPLMGFLLVDRASLHAGWWDVYFRLQVLASATGARTDGAPQFWYPFITIAGRFWPGLPLVALGLALTLRERKRGPAAMLAIFCAAMLCLLCLPARKVWNHEMVAYPGLALCAGSSCVPAQRWLVGHAKQIVIALIAVSIAAIGASPWIGCLLDGPPCVLSSEFAAGLDALSADEVILVVSRPTSWRTISALAAERRLEPEPLETLPNTTSTSARLAMVEAEGAPYPLPSGWEQIAAARGWVLLRRRN